VVFVETTQTLIVQYACGFVTGWVDDPVQAEPGCCNCFNSDWGRTFQVTSTDFGTVSCTLISHVQVRLLLLLSIVYF
jgi:hypothetical protein